MDQFCNNCVVTNNGPTTASFLVYHSQVPSLQNENGNILENKAIVVAAEFGNVGTYAV